jgi:hypothetical protein
VDILGPSGQSESEVRVLFVCSISNKKKHKRASISTLMCCQDEKHSQAVDIVAIHDFSPKL